MAQQLATVDTAHAGLKQPADLKPVFDAAYGRDVTGPANAFQKVLPVADDALAAAVSVGDFLAQRSNVGAVEGAQVQVSDPAVQRDLSGRLAAMNSKSQAVQVGQRRMQTLING